MKNFSLAITMLFCFMAFGQDKTVSGIVSDSIGVIPGANVVVKGTTRSAQTDFEGKFTIKAKAGEVLVFSFTSYQSLQITVGASNSYNVKLRQSEIQLQEVVTPYDNSYFKRKKTIAQTTVKVEDIGKPKTEFVMPENDNTKYVLDGRLITSDEFKVIKPENIESITILKKDTPSNIVLCGKRYDVIIIKSKKISKREMRKQKREAKKIKDTITN